MPQACLTPTPGVGGLKFTEKTKERTHDSHGFFLWYARTETAHHHSASERAPAGELDDRTADLTPAEAVVAGGSESTETNQTKNP